MPVYSFHLRFFFNVLYLRVMRQEDGTGKWTHPILVFDCLIARFITAHTVAEKP